MAVLWLQGIVAAVLGAVAAWRLVGLLREPAPTRGRVVVFVLFASAFVSNLAELPFAHRALDGIASGLAGLVSSLALLGFFSGFLVFLGEVSRRRFLRSARAQTALVAVVALVLVVTWALSIPTGNTMQFIALPPDAPAPLWTYSLVSLLYLAYACLAGTSLAFAESARAARGGRLALGVCATGMLFSFTGGTLLRLPATVVVALGAATAPDGSGRAFLALSQGTTTSTILGIGIVVTTLGMALVGLGTVAAKVRMALRARRELRLLRPLRRDLAESFAPIASAGPGGRGAASLGPTGTLYRYGRAVVECRDGLWQLSPWLDPLPTPDPDDDADPDGLAHRVGRALERYGRGDDPVGSPVAVAAPRPGAPADEPLLALARSYAALSRPGARPAVIR